MDKQYTCFFTGHRKLPANKYEQIREIVKNRIRTLIEDKGVETFIAGGALGFDTLAEECVAELREEYPGIKLYLYLPCHDQSAMWNENDRFKWSLMKAKADGIRYVTDGKYTNGCMQKRNRAMADVSGYCIAYCVMSRSGTGSTVRYAEQTGIAVENIADEIYK